MPVATWRVFYHPAVLWWTSAKTEEHTKQEEIVNQSVNECERKMSCLIIENRFTEGKSSYAKKIIGAAVFTPLQNNRGVPSFPVPQTTL